MITTHVTSYLKRNEDLHTSGWPLVSDFSHTCMICALYLLFVKVLVPKFMKNREPLQLNKILFGYNLFQILLSTWLFYEFSAAGWLTGQYSFKCQPIDYSQNPSSLRMNRATWWYFLSKFTELPETIFFLLRKKYDQVNILHVYHHAIMPMSGWLATKYYPNGHGTFPGLANTFVHIIMYLYYLLSSMGPSVQKYLWWKKYLTALQMAQFTLIMVHTFQLLFSDCNFPRIFVWYMGLLALSFYFLFKSFYNKAYANKKV